MVTLSNYIKSNDLENLKKYIEKNSLTVGKLNKGPVNYDILLDAIDNCTSQELIEYCVSLYDNLNYSFNKTHVPLYLAVKKNNFKIADMLIKNNADINYLNENKGNILSYLLIESINHDNLKYVIDKGVDINYNLYQNNIDSLLTSIDNDKSEKEVSNFFNPYLKKNVIITCFDYIYCEGCLMKHNALLEDIIKFKDFNPDKINEKTLKLISGFKSENNSNSYYKLLIKSKLNVILERAIENKNIKQIKSIFQKVDISNIMEDTIMDILIEKGIQDEEIYDLLYKNICPLDESYIKKLDKNKIIAENLGLIKSLIKNGFYVRIKTDSNDMISYIDNPLLYFAKNNCNILVEKLLENKVFVDKVDDMGFSSLYYTIQNKNNKLFNILLNKYNANIAVRNNMGQTPYDYAIELACDNYNMKSMEPFITTLEIIGKKYIKNIINDLENKKFNEAKNDIEQLAVDVNLLYNNKTIMKIMIENIIDNEEIFNILFKKKAFILDTYFSNKQKHLVIKNSGLIKSIIKNGFYVKDEAYNSIFLINDSLIYFIKEGQNEIVKKLLENNAPVEKKIKKNGFTPIFQAIESRNYEIFNILINKYHSDITIKDNNNRTPLMLAIELSKKNKNDQIMKNIISKLDNYENKKELKSPIKEEKLFNLPNKFSDIVGLAKESKAKENCYITDNSIIHEKSNIVNNEIFNVIDNTILSIIHAIEQKNFEKVVHVLNQPNINVNQLYNGKTIMNFMIENNIDNELIYNLLFKKKAYISDTYFNKNKNKLIISNSGLIKSIIKNGFYVKDQTNLVSLIKSPLIYFIKNTRNKIVKKLLENNASIEERNDKTGFTPIFQAIKSKNYKIFNILINKYNPDITKMDSKKRTPIMLARNIMKKKYVTKLEKYIKNKKELNSIVKPLQQPTTLLNNIITANVSPEKTINLNENTINNNNERFNIFNNEESNVVDYEEFNIIDTWKSNIVDNPILSLIHATEQKNYEKVVHILNQPNINVNQLYNGKTIMSFMIENNIDNELIYNLLFKKKAYFSDTKFNKRKSKLIISNSGLIKSIIKNGFYVKDQTNLVSLIKSPLIYFIKYTKNKIAKTLLENNASIEEVDEKTGFTPIFQAIKSKNYEMFNILINKYNPDITKMDKNKRTPLMFAKQRGNINFISDLENYIENKKKLNSLVKPVQPTIFSNIINKNNISPEKIVNINENNENSNIVNNEKFNIFDNEKSNISDTEKSNIVDNPILLIIHAIEQKNFEKVVPILNQPNINVNQLYSGKTIMSFVIENNIDNELIYNLLFKKKAYISDTYFNKRKSKLIISNSGLIKSIIKNGFYVKDQTNLVSLI